MIRSAAATIAAPVASHILGIGTWGDAAAACVCLTAACTLIAAIVRRGSKALEKKIDDRVDLLEERLVARLEELATDTKQLSPNSGTHLHDRVTDMAEDLADLRIALGLPATSSRAT